MAGRIEAKLAELGLEVPEAPMAVGNYVGQVVVGNLAFISGQVTLKDGKFEFVGKVGKDFSIEEGQAAAKLCALNILSQLKAACGGDLDRVKRIVRLGGFVNSGPDFKEQSKVINGASELMVAIFGEQGRHARAAVSVASLPGGVAVEVEAIAEIV